MATETEKVKVKVNCSHCDSCRDVKLSSAGNPLTPKSWKKIDGKYTCNKCWKSKYVIRRFTFSINGVMPYKDSGEWNIDENWKDFRSNLNRCWKETAQIKNNLVAKLYAADMEQIDYTSDKLHSFKAPYLYRECCDLVPGYPTNSIVSIMQEVQLAYNADRWDLMKTQKRSLRTYRTPQPFPLKAGNYKLEKRGDEFVISSRVGSQRYAMRISQGRNFKRMREHLQRAIDSPVLQSEALLKRKSTYLSSGPATVLLQLTMWIPKVENLGRHGTLFVRTDSQSLLVALNKKDQKLWIKNGDHIRRWEHQHANQLQRWAEDTKAEQRPVPSFSDRRSQAVVKHRNRINTAIHQTSDEVVKYAVRRNFATIQYDDTQDRFCDSFPYFQLKQDIKNKCEQRGIAFIEKENKQ